jgi:hypothetical protein
MPTAYTTKKNGSITEIYRNEDQIASYDPVSEETTYIKAEYEKYSNHVGRAVNDLKTAEKAASAPVNTPEVPPVPPEVVKLPVVASQPIVPIVTVTVVEEDKDTTIRRLKSQLQDAHAENARLLDQIKKKPSEVREPERFADKFDLTGAPAQDGQLGDLTPAFIEWAREKMPKEIFEKRYKNRLPKA